MPRGRGGHELRQPRRVHHVAPRQRLGAAAGGRVRSRVSGHVCLLQNVVVSAAECGQERLQFWSRFVDLYYHTYGGSVR